MNPYQLERALRERPFWSYLPFMCGYWLQKIYSQAQREYLLRADCRMKSTDTIFITLGQERSGKSLAQWNYLNRYLHHDYCGKIHCESQCARLKPCAKPIPDGYTFHGCARCGHLSVCHTGYELPK